MKQLSAYLAFSGDCEAALNFYKDCFDGEIKSMQRFGDAPMPSDDSYKDKIMHAEFSADGISFMASDGMPGHQINRGDNINLSIDFNDAEEEEKVFKALSDGGVVTMPLQDTFWGAKFGMVTDKFGINWMVNCTVNPS